MKNSICIIIIQLMLCFPSYAASTVYQTDVSVQSQSEAERTAAIQQGFLQVLQNVSKHPEIAELDVIKNNLKNADSYLQEYSYGVTSMAPKTFSLHLTFTARDINRLVAKVKLPAAPTVSGTPSIFIWAAIHSEQNLVDVIGGDTTHLFTKVMQSSSKKLQFIFPMLDAQDMQAVSVAKIDSKEIAPLTAAAKRYEPDAILIGSIFAKANQYEGEWLFIWKEKEWRWKISKSTQEEFASAVTSRVEKVFAGEVLPVVPASPQAIELTITGITKPDDLGSLMQILNGLSPIQDVELQEVSGSQVYLTVKSAIALADLQHLLDSQPRLRFLANPEMNELEYEWQDMPEQEIPIQANPQD